MCRTENIAMSYCGEINDTDDIYHVVCNGAKAIQGHLLFEWGVEIFMDIRV